MKQYRITCPKFTCLLVVNTRDVIEEACPFLRRFVGQDVTRCLSWCERTFDDVEWETL